MRYLSPMSCVAVFSFAYYQSSSFCPWSVLHLSVVLVGAPILLPLCLLSSSFHHLWLACVPFSPTSALSIIQWQTHCPQCPACWALSIYNHALLWSPVSTCMLLSWIALLGPPSSCTVICLFFYAIWYFFGLPWNSECPCFMSLPLQYGPAQSMLF